MLGSTSSGDSAAIAAWFAVVVGIAGVAITTRLGVRAAEAGEESARAAKRALELAEEEARQSRTAAQAAVESVAQARTDIRRRRLERIAELFIDANRAADDLKEAVDYQRQPVTSTGQMATLERANRNTAVEQATARLSKLQIQARIALFGLEEIVPGADKVIDNRAGAMLLYVRDDDWAKVHDALANALRELDDKPDNSHQATSGE